MKHTNHLLEPDVDRAIVEDRFLCNGHQFIPMPTAPFHEQFVVAAIKEYANKTNVAITEDPAGNLFLLYNGGKLTQSTPHMIMTAHMDHPGLMYVETLSDCEYQFELIGNVDIELAKQAPVDIYFNASGPDQQPIRGIIESFQTLNSKTGKSEFLRCEVRTAEPIRNPIETECFAMWHVPPLQQKGRKLHGRACDDLAGLSVALTVIDILRYSQSPACVGILLTRAEETGFGGMMAAVVQEWLRKQSIYINIECSNYLAGACLGMGPVIRVGDRLSIFDAEITAALVEIAENENPQRLPYQRKLMDGGSCEATVLSQWGYRVGAVTLPLYNYHNAGKKSLRSEAINIDDAINLVLLLVRMTTHMISNHSIDDLTGGKLKNALEDRYYHQKKHLFNRPDVPDRFS